MYAETVSSECDEMINKSIFNERSCSPDAEFTMNAGTCGGGCAEGSRGCARILDVVNGVRCVLWVLGVMLCMLF